MNEGALTARVAPGFTGQGVRGSDRSLDMSDGLYENNVEGVGGKRGLEDDLSNLIRVRHRWNFSRLRCVELKVVSYG